MEHHNERAQLCCSGPKRGSTTDLEMSLYAKPYTSRPLAIATGWPFGTCATKDGILLFQERDWTPHRLPGGLCHKSKCRGIWGHDPKLVQRPGSGRAFVPDFEQRLDGSVMSTWKYSKVQADRDLQYPRRGQYPGGNEQRMAPRHKETGLIR